MLTVIVNKLPAKTNKVKASEAQTSLATQPHSGGSGEQLAKKYPRNRTQPTMIAAILLYVYRVVRLNPLLSVLILLSHRNSIV